MNPLQLSTLHKDTVIALAIAVGMLFLVPAVSMLSVRFTSDDWYLMDEGTVLYSAFRSSFGEVPHIKTVYFYTGGFEILLGVVFNIFGSTLTVARWTLGVNMAATASLAYLICRKASVDRAVAAWFTVVATALCYGMNFHIYPAWYCGTLILLAVLLMWQGLRTHEQRVWCLLSGVCLGVASCLKQTSGLYGLFSFILCALIVASTSKSEAAATGRQSRARLRVQMIIILIIPSMILSFLVLILRSRLTLLNLLMFMTVPTIIVLYTVKVVTLAWRRSPDVWDRVTSAATQSIAPLVLGAGIGFLPLVIFYIVQGAFTQFMGDSFLNIQQMLETRYSVFKFVDDAATVNAIVFVRWLLLFIIPLITSLLGFYSVIRNDRFNERHMLLLLVSTLIAFSYFTLYPIAIRMYVLFLVPLVSIVIACFTDVALKRLIASSILRLSVVLSLFLILVTAYVGSRTLAGDLTRITDEEIALLEPGGESAYVPKKTIDYLQPVLQYLKSRSPEESFVALDGFNRLVAFLTHREIQADYLQWHSFNEITQSDFIDLASLAEKRKVDTIVIGKRHLPNTPPANKLVDSLKKYYILVLGNQTHLVYQRIPIHTGDDSSHAQTQI